MTNATVSHGPENDRGFIAKALTQAVFLVLFILDASPVVMTRFFALIKDKMYRSPD